MTKVLLVEDDNNLREIYEARLAAEGYDIVTAKDGEEALDVAKEHKPDLIISDVMMPRVSGFEMLDILRTTDGLKNTKVIMLTALGQTEDKARADNLGADRYLVKSQVTLEDIVKTASELLGGDANQADTELTPASFASPAPQTAETAPVIVSGTPVVQAPVAPTPQAPVMPVAQQAQPVASSAQPVQQVPAPNPVAAPIMSNIVAPEMPAENHMATSNPMPTIPIATPPVSTPVEPVAVPAPQTPVVATPVLDPVIPQATQPVTQPIQVAPIIDTPVAQAPLVTVTSEQPPTPVPSPIIVEAPQQAQEQNTPTPEAPAAPQETAAAEQTPAEPVVDMSLPVVEMPNLEVQTETAPTTSIDQTQAQPLLTATDTTIVTDAQTTNDEEAAVEKQIDDFIHTESVIPQIEVAASSAEQADDEANASNNASIINQAVEQLVTTAPPEPATPDASVQAQEDHPSSDPAAAPHEQSVSQIPGKKVIQPIAVPEGKADLATLLAQEEMNENLQRGVTGAPVVGGAEDATPTPPLPPLANPAPPAAPFVPTPVVATDPAVPETPPSVPTDGAFTPNNGGSAEANAL